ncbi:hypothetical protein ACHAXM_010991 [Skeletonema potamos]
MQLSNRTRLALEARGQQFIPTKLGLGSVQATNTLTAVSGITIERMEYLTHTRHDKYTSDLSIIYLEDSFVHQTQHL